MSDPTPATRVWTKQQQQQQQQQPQQQQQQQQQQQTCGFQNNDNVFLAQSSSSRQDAHNDHDQKIGSCPTTESQKSSSGVSESDDATNSDDAVVCQNFTQCQLTCSHHARTETEANGGSYSRPSNATISSCDRKSNATVSSCDRKSNATVSSCDRKSNATVSSCDRKSNATVSSHLRQADDVHLQSGSSSPPIHVSSCDRKSCDRKWKTVSLPLTSSSMDSGKGSMAADCHCPACCSCHGNMPKGTDCAHHQNSGNNSTASIAHQNAALGSEWSLPSPSSVKSWGHFCQSGRNNYKYRRSDCSSGSDDEMSGAGLSQWPPVNHHPTSHNMLARKSHLPQALHRQSSLGEKVKAVETDVREDGGPRCARDGCCARDDSLNRDRSVDGESQVPLDTSNPGVKPAVFKEEVTVCGYFHLSCNIH
jgi:hypothetical protein